jgi:hypothetical protein
MCRLTADSGNCVSVTPDKPVAARSDHVQGAEQGQRLTLRTIPKIRWAISSSHSLRFMRSPVRLHDVLHSHWPHCTVARLLATLGPSRFNRGTRPVFTSASACTDTPAPPKRPPAPPPPYARQESVYGDQRSGQTGAQFPIWACLHGRQGPSWARNRPPGDGRGEAVIAGRDAGPLKYWWDGLASGDNHRFP